MPPSPRRWPPPLCWLLGNLAWLLGGDAQPAIPWWLAFLVLTIAGERLELTRLLPLSASARHGFALAALALCAAAALSLWSPDAGLRLYAAALLALAAWLLRHDIARRNARQRGLTRYIAIALLCGYGWLASPARSAWPARCCPATLARRGLARAGPGLRVFHGVRPRSHHHPGADAAEAAL